MKHFFAYMSRMKHIKRWGLMRNSVEENIAEHSHMAAIIAHCLALVHNKIYGGNIDVNAVITFALYHEAAEVITGDLPTPIKYYNEDIKKAYKEIEHLSSHRLLTMLPDELKPCYEDFILQRADKKVLQMVKAADKICAYIKCIEEKKNGNCEFDKAAVRLRESLDQLDMPEVQYFIDHFLPSFYLTLDELNT